MKIQIGGLSFEGPFTSEEALENQSGIYAVLCRDENSLMLLEIGETSLVRTRLSEHEHKSRWMSNRTGQLLYAVHYTPHKQQPARIMIEQSIRGTFSPPCIIS